MAVIPACAVSQWALHACSVKACVQDNEANKADTLSTPSAVLSLYLSLSLFLYLSIALSLSAILQR